MAAINLCFQLRNLGIGGDDRARAKKLCCALRLKPSSEAHHKEFYAGWRSSWLKDNESDRSESNVSIIEALMERVCTFDGSSDSYRADTVQCDVNEKGQGFSSCTISTLDLGCGLFRIDVVAVCLDGRGHVWMLRPMADGPIVRVTSAARID
jgi:integrator complex subunit 7